tara:strand:+ start:1014 stop:1319 length:306 start_codon:yes stop_codon:yes gene_type:complete
MSHAGNDELRERFAEDAQEMSHREKVMILMGFFYDSGLWITVDTDPIIRTNPSMFHYSQEHDFVMGQTPSERKEKLDILLIEVMHHIHLHGGDTGESGDER